MGDHTEKINKFVEELTRDEKMLVILRDELYDGKWDLMIQDLKDRLNQGPYIFKLAGTIENDLKIIKKLQAFEKKNKTDIGKILRQI